MSGSVSRWRGEPGQSCQVLTLGIGRRALLAVFMLQLFVLLSVFSASCPSSPASASDSAGYTELPVWIDSAKPAKIITGEFDAQHHASELIVADDGGRVMLLEETDYAWKSACIATIPGAVTALASGNIMPSSAENEVVAGNAAGELYLISFEGNKWKCSKIGDGAAHGWGAITGIVVDKVDLGYENDVVVLTGTAGRVAELIYFDGSWISSSIYSSGYSINAIAAGELDAAHAGKELVVITGECENAAIVISSCSGPILLSETGPASGWSATKVWSSESALRSVSVGNIGSLSGQQQILVLSGTERASVPYYKLTKISLVSGNWYPEDIYSANRRMAFTVGDFNRTNPGNEIALSDDSNTVSMLFRERDWESAVLWNSPREVVGICAGDVSGSLCGGELIITDSSCRVIALTEGRLLSPCVEIVSPASGQVVTGESTEVRWAGRDWNGKAAVDLYYSAVSSGGPWTSIASRLPTSGSMPWTLPGGGYDFWLTCILRDSIGLTSYHTVAVSRFRDVEPPVICHTPVSASYRNEAITIHATVTDNVALAYVSLYYRPSGQTGYTVQALCPAQAASGNAYSSVIPSSSVLGSAIDYYITAFDTSGNIAIAPETAPATPYRITIVEKYSQPVLDRVAISPGDARLTVGQEIRFTASALDNKSAPVSPNFTWSAAGNIGTIDTTGFFRATGAGRGYVEVCATLNNVTKTCRAAITVESASFSLTGKVQDSGGSPVEGALARLESAGGSWRREATSDASGAFAFTDVPKGDTYVLVLEKSGYGRETKAGITGSGNLIVTLKLIPKAQASPVVPKEAALAVIILASLFSFAVLVRMFGDYLKYGFFALFAPLYSKIKKDDVLDNFVRGQVYGHIKTNPGTHYSRIKRTLGIKNGSLAYHLRTLERSEFIKSKFDGKFKRFYPCGMAIPDPSGTVLSEAQKKIVGVISKNPGITQSDVAGILNVKKQNVNYHIMQLVRANILQVIGIGRKTRCYLNET